MPTCPSCNAPLKDGDWTCGQCGAPVAGAGMPDAPHTGDYRTPAGAAAPSSTGSSGLLKPVLIIGLVAVVAIVLVWFFVLRGPRTTGDEFLGTWTSATQTGIATAVVDRDGDAFSVSLSGSTEDQKITVPAHLDGDDLVITMDDLSQIAGEDEADRFKAMLKALTGDFRMVLTSVDATHVDLRIVGTSASGEDFEQTIPLVKQAAGTS